MSESPLASLIDTYRTALQSGDHAGINAALLEAIEHDWWDAPNGERWMDHLRAVAVQAAPVA